MMSFILCRIVPMFRSMSNRKPQSADGPTKMPTFLDLLQRVTNVEVCILLL